MNVDLAQAKLHLRVTSSSEDAIIQAYINAAKAWIAKFITGEVDAVNPPADLVAAQLLLIGHYYQNREASGTERLAEIPLGVDALCRPYRTPTIA